MRWGDRVQGERIMVDFCSGVGKSRVWVRVPVSTAVYEVVAYAHGKADPGYEVRPVRQIFKLRAAEEPNCIRLERK